MSIEITEDSPEGELPILTPKQSAFVNALLQGKTASDAYREAYNCDKMSQGAISVEASRLRRSPKISLWLKHFQWSTAQVTLQDHMAELARARELAIAHGQISAGVQAEHYRGKAVGLYEERIRLTSEPSDDDLIGRIKELFGKEMADEIANALGHLV
jgi:hypothetical protein